jgi:hypothetical protein
VSKVDLRLQCGMPCSKLEVSTAQHGTLSGAGYLHQSRKNHPKHAFLFNVSHGRSTLESGRWATGKEAPGAAVPETKL